MSNIEWTLADYNAAAILCRPNAYAEVADYLNLNDRGKFLLANAVHDYRVNDESHRHRAARLLVHIMGPAVMGTYLRAVRGYAY